VDNAVTLDTFLKSLHHYSLLHRLRWTDKQTDRQLPFLKNLRICYTRVCHMGVNTTAPMPSRTLYTYTYAEGRYTYSYAE